MSKIFTSAVRYFVCCSLLVPYIMATPEISPETKVMPNGAETSVIKGEELVQKVIISQKTEKEMKIETTLIILKPDCMEKGLQGEIIRRFNEQKFEIVGCKMTSLTESVLKEHYSHLTHLPFFPEIMTFMRSKPVMVMALRGENIIERMRTLLGPTDSALAPKGSIRGDFGTDKMRNIAHASDSEESAQKELKRFFQFDELFM